MIAGRQQSGHGGDSPQLRGAEPGPARDQEVAREPEAGDCGRGPRHQDIGGHHEWHWPGGGGGGLHQHPAAGGQQGEAGAAQEIRDHGDWHPGEGGVQGAPRLQTNLRLHVPALLPPGHVSLCQGRIFLHKLRLFCGSSKECTQRSECNGIFKTPLIQLKLSWNRCLIDLLSILQCTAS